MSIFKSDSVTSLQDLFKHELADLYSAEKQILEALPQMIKVTSAKGMKGVFDEGIEIISRDEEVAPDKKQASQTPP